MPKIYERENIRLATENRRLQRQLDMARNCIKYYADPINYPTTVIHYHLELEARNTLKNVFGEDA